MNKKIITLCACIALMGQVFGAQVESDFEKKLNSAVQNKKLVVIEKNGGRYIMAGPGLRRPLVSHFGAQAGAGIFAAAAASIISDSATGKEDISSFDLVAAAVGLLGIAYVEYTKVQQDKEATEVLNEHLAKLQQCACEEEEKTAWWQHL